MKLINMLIAVAAAQQCSGSISRQRALQLATGRVKLNRCDLVALATTREQAKPARVNIHHWKVRTSDFYQKLGFQF